MTTELVLPTRYQGATGKGHGGYTAGLLSESAPGRRTVDFYVSIPLGIPLQLEEVDGVQHLRNGETAVARTRPTDKSIHIPDPVNVDEAAGAQARSPIRNLNVLPDCFSCGTLPDSMNVHAGPLDGRDEFATTWTPEQRHAENEEVLDRYIWGAIDCPSGWVIGVSGDEFRPSVTGEMWAEVFEPVRPGETYVAVAWGGAWRGRMAAAGTSLFASDGRCVAAAESMWVALS